MAARKRRTGGGATPKARKVQVDRPDIQGYGVPTGTGGLLPWSAVEDRMREALHYWVSTVDPGGRPHATPVDGLWMDGRLYFGGNAGTRRGRNLRTNPAVCVHLESASDVVILHGDVEEVPVAGNRGLARRLSDASKEKYGYGPSPEMYETALVHSLRPRKVLAWKQFPADATRWRFDH